MGRLQLAQPALTLGWSVLLLGERVSLLTGAAAGAVIAATAVGRNAHVDPAWMPAPEPGPGAEYPPGSRQMGLPAVPP